LLIVLVCFSLPSYAASKLYPQLESQTIQNIAGNWQVTLKSKEGNQLHQYYIRMEAPYTSYCDEISEQICRYDVRDTSGEWVSAYVWAGNTFHRSFDITSPSAMTYDHAYGVVDHWGVSSKISFGGNTGKGKWRYGDTEGPEVWKRLIPAIEKTVFYPVVRNPYKEYSPTGVSENGSIGKVTGKYSQPTWGPQNNAPGNRPFFYFNVYGKNLWGFHVLDMKGAVGFGVPVCNNNLYKNNSGQLADHIGLRCYVHVWPGSTNGTKTIRFDNIEIPFDFNIAGLAQPLTAIVNIPDNWRYRDAMGEEDDYPKVDLNGADYAWKLKTNKTKDWPTIKLNITGDSVAELDANKVSFANPKLQLRSKQISGDSIQLTVTLLPQAKHGDTTVTVDGKTLPFSFEYQGGFPDLAISNETLDPNDRYGAYANFNLTRPLSSIHKSDMERQKMIARVINNSETAAKDLVFDITPPSNTTWSYPETIQSCSESDEVCYDCQQQWTGAGVGYTCKGLNLGKNEALIAYFYAQQKDTTGPKQEPVVQNVACELDSPRFYISVRTSEEKQTGSAKNKQADFKVSTFDFNVADVAFEGLPLNPNTLSGKDLTEYTGRNIFYGDERTSVEFRAHLGRRHDSDYRPILYTLGQAYPLTNLHPLGFFRVKIKLNKPACPDAKSRLLLEIKSPEGAVTFEEIELAVSEEGSVLTHERLLYAGRVGTSYNAVFGKHKKEIKIEPLPATTFALVSMAENGSNYRTVRDGGLFRIKYSFAGTNAPPNIPAIPVSYMWKPDYAQAFKETGIFLIPKTDVRSFSEREIIQLDHFSEEARSIPSKSGSIILPRNKNSQPAAAGLDKLHVASYEEDIYQFKTLFFSLSKSVDVISEATLDQTIRAWVSFKKSAPEKSTLTLSVVSNGKVITEKTVGANRSTDGRHLHSEPIILSSFGEIGVDDQVQLKWLEDPQDGRVLSKPRELSSDSAAQLNVAGRPGVLTSLLVTQNGKETSSVKLGESFTVKAEFEKEPTEKPKIGLKIKTNNKSQIIANEFFFHNIEKISDSKASYTRDFKINSYQGHEQGYDLLAFAGDELVIKHNKDYKSVTLYDELAEDEKMVTFVTENGFGHKIDARGFLESAGKSMKAIVSNRPIAIPKGDYQLTMRFENCCIYKSAIKITSESPAKIEIPKLAHIAIAAKNLSRELMEKSTISAIEDLSNRDKGWSMTKTAGPSPFIRGLELPPGKFVFTLTLPNGKSMTRVESEVSSGQNSLIIPSVQQFRVDVFDVAGQQRFGKISNRNSEDWSVGKVIYGFKNTSNSTLVRKIYGSNGDIPFSTLASFNTAEPNNKIVIKLGQAIFPENSSSRYEHIGYHLCPAQNELGTIDSDSGDCIAVKTGVTYDLYPRQYLLLNHLRIKRGSLDAETRDYADKYNISRDRTLKIPFTIRPGTKKTAFTGAQKRK
jgi:hypothetical protein